MIERRRQRGAMHGGYALSVHYRTGMSNQIDEWYEQAERRRPQIRGLRDRNTHNLAEGGHVDGLDLRPAERLGLSSVLVDELRLSIETAARVRDMQVSTAELIEIGLNNCGWRGCRFHNFPFYGTNVDLLPTGAFQDARDCRCETP